MAFFVFFAEAAGLRDQINEGIPLTTFAQDSRAGRRTSPAIQRRRETSGAASILPCPFAEQLRPPTGSLSVRYLSCKGEYTTHMAEKLKIIPLGGLNEIGKNMTAYEYGGEIIVVDCGMAFPGDDMYGIDCVIPDVTYLIKNRSRLRGLFITHGHEDHIGAIPYVLKQVNMPIYCTRFTAGLIKLKLQEHRLLDSTKLVTVEAGQTVKAGKFQVEFIHVNHSIADSVAFAIHTRMGVVVHTGDFKIDSTPIDGEVIDLARFGALGKEGVLALLAALTNASKYDSKILVEEFINGREVEVAVLGNAGPAASVCGEIDSGTEFYDYDAKYISDCAQLYIPARIPEEVSERVRDNAIRIYEAMGCRGLSRVDFFVTYEGQEIVFNEINTLPGFTSISMYPKLFEASGIPYPELLDNLIELALED